MNRSIFILLLAVISFKSDGQKIESTSLFGERKFYQDGRKLKMYQLKDLLNENAESKQLYSKATSNYTLAQVVGIPGGFLIGWQLGRMLTGNQPNTTGLLVGFALEAIYIPLQHSYNINSQKAVAIYNEQYTALPQKKLNWFVLVNQNGIGVGAKF